MNYDLSNCIGPDHERYVESSVIAKKGLAETQQIMDDWKSGKLTDVQAYYLIFYCP